MIDHVARDNLIVIYGCVVLAQRRSPDDVSLYNAHVTTTHVGVARAAMRASEGQFREPDSTQLHSTQLAVELS